MEVHYRVDPVCKIILKTGLVQAIQLKTVSCSLKVFIKINQPTSQRQTALGEDFPKEFFQSSFSVVSLFT